MSQLITEQPKSLLVLALLYRRDIHSRETILSKLPDDWRVFSLYEDLPVEIATMKSYYSKEMGDVDLLQRDFLIFHNMMPKNSLVELKELCQKIEFPNKDLNERTLNLDFGLLSLENFLLATGKSFSHRVYLDRGVFAELTYQTDGNRYQTLPWTYPDYNNESVIQFFEAGRQYLKTLLKP
ncbi:MAG: DUF4416 family protein [Oligoflexia bacterium]|nr:DUF4416 family protein [Oligoflexia bacterium]